jgi:membrane protein DedA with SNARE-associated domain
MPFSFDALWSQILSWTHSYGYHAVVPTLIADPAGVPWAWIFLLLIAEEARLNVFLMLAYGFAVLSLWDHAMYWLGARGGRPLVERLGQRWPRLASSMESAEKAMQGRGSWAVALGRYLPIVGRWVGLGAGLANVSYARFALFDAIGVACTTLVFGVAAHVIGRSTINEPWFPQAVTGAYIFTTIITALVTAWQGWRLKKKRAAA